jgi:uncharacterized membrane protein YozB (DUF420 family)
MKNLIEGTHVLRILKKMTNTDLKTKNYNLSRYYLGFAIVGIIVTVLGFIPTYFQPLTEAKSFALIYHMHGFFCASWLILFLVQTALINQRNARLHQKLGFLGVFVALGVMVTLQRVGFVTASREIETSTGFGANTFLGTVLDSLTFAGLVVTAIFLRKRIESHRRLMLLATMLLLWVSWVRLRYYFPPFPGNFEVFGFGLAMLPIPTFWIIEWRLSGQVHPVMIKAGVLVIFEQGIQVIMPYVGLAQELSHIATALFTAFEGEIPK